MWSDGVMMLGKLPVMGRPKNIDYSRQGPNAHAVGAGGVVWIFFLLLFHFCLPLSERRPDID